MAMNLRLRPEQASALKAESDRTGLSQQEILRRAVDEHLGLVEKTRDELPAWVEPPARPLRAISPVYRLPEDVTIESILDEIRADRL